MLIAGLGITVFGSIWKTLWHELFEKRGGGEGRLAWQCSEVGGHPMLWHNGMVGGAASFLGIVPELEIGVVVLTNTAKSVDAIGVKILSELVKLKENELREQMRIAMAPIDSTAVPAFRPDSTLRALPTVRRRPRARR